MTSNPNEEARVGPLPLPAPAADRITRIDFGLLARSRELRLLISGQGVTSVGSTVTAVALPFQAYHLTHSTLVVGLLSLAEFVPLLVTAFVGGGLADAVDRRRLILLCELAMGVATVGLVVNAGAAHPQLWPLFVVGAVVTTAYGLQRPSLDAIVPRVVDARDIPAASSLVSLVWSSAMVTGPRPTSSTSRPTRPPSPRSRRCARRRRRPTPTASRSPPSPPDFATRAAGATCSEAISSI
ncbi:MAG: MFS transporter [Solirubrobacteraceae bacterium]